MSGTGRPTYRNRKGSANPAAAYIPTTHVMARDMPGHLKIKTREKKVFNREELQKKLKALEGAKNNFEEVGNFEDEDADETESSFSDDSDSDDDNNALLNELNRIKKEKAEEEEQKLRDVQAQARAQFTANPLMDPEYSMNQKWTEESVFQNQAVNEPKENKQFVNDLIRNDYHKKFLRKYLRV